MMKSILFLCAVALCLQYAAAADCSKLSVVAGTCPDGLALASSDVVTACQVELCGMVDTWQMVGYDTPNMVFVGNGYDATCGTQSYFGTPGDVLCAAGGGGGGGDDGGLTGGGVFLIIFFVGGFVYFAGGFAYNYQAKQLRGSEAIPNAAFWKDLPALMKDGAGFLKNKVTGGGGNYTSV